MSKKIVPRRGIKPGVGRPSEPPYLTAPTQISFRLTQEQTFLLNQFVLPHETIHTTARRVLLDSLTGVFKFWYRDQHEVDVTNGRVRRPIDLGGGFHRIRITFRMVNELSGIPEVNSMGDNFYPLTPEGNRSYSWYKAIDEGKKAFLTLDGISCWEIVEFPVLELLGRSVVTFRCVRLEPETRGNFMTRNKIQTIEFFEITKAADTYFYIAPMSAATNGRYLIRCSSRAEADRLVKDLAGGVMPTPLADHTSYRPVELHINGQTVIFERKDHE